MKRLVALALLAGCATTRAREPEWVEVGRSVEGRSIRAIEFGRGHDVTLVFGGFHGDEMTAIAVAETLCREMPRILPLLEDARVIIVPVLNPDGRAARRRQNARGVDLNRNFPTKDWERNGASPGSEPETRVAMDLVERHRPARIISIHDPLRVNNYDGEQSEGLARAMAVHNRYAVKGDIGYPTPGSFGTWAGKERRIPMVTLEVPRGDAGRVWLENKWAFVAALRHKPAALMKK